MKKIVLGMAFASALVAMASAQGAARDALDWVDPFIGTQGTGHTTPAAACPFGMVQPGPDTSHAGWEHCSAYQYGDRRIERFSQNHLSGTGCSEFTDVGFMPFAGNFNAAWRRDCFQKIDKATEKASPGYYAVTLDTGVRVEMTCTERVAIYKITYLKAPAHLLFDPSWAFGSVQSVDFTPMKDGKVAGHVFRDGWPDHDYWFAWEVSKAPTSSRVVEHIGDDRIEKTAYTFDMKAGDILYLKVSLSRSSAAGAWRNIEAEIPGWDFDGVRAQAQAKWRVILSRVKAKGTDEQMKGLYTSIYHLCFQPNLISDAGEPNVYSTFSCWDTYRAAGPLYTILTPERVPDFINSMLWHFDQNGFLPVWTLWGGDNQCMIGVHSVPMIVDAYLKGFKGVDWERAWRCVKTTLTKNRRRHKARYDLLDKYGYYPCDVVKDESVSRQLESCYDDACAARFAEALDKKRSAKFFRDRSLSWTNCFDAATGFIRARDKKGAWREPFDPYKISHINHCDYTEGNAFHWNWHMMQSPELIVNLLGGKDVALKRLDGLFNEDSTKGVGAIPDVTGLIGQYCHGNEPSHHVIYFFTLLGRRDLAAKYIREVMDTQYGTTPDGLCGNDDCGQMSAWYIFAAMGIYPFDPCGRGYVLGEAQMKEISIDVGEGKRFRVVSDAPGAASRAVELNGRGLDGVVISHEDVMKGGTLHFAGGVAREAEFEYTFDASAAPELEDWMRRKMAPAIRKWYPKLVEMFPSEGWKPYRRLTFCFNDIDYPAYTSGSKVTFDRKWIKENPGDVGCGIHELFHVIQGSYRKAPAWLTEGIADYVRFYLYEPESRGCEMDVKRDDIHCNGSYRVSANFLNFVEKKHPGTVKELNALCRQGKYSENNYWQKRTGKTLPELEQEWKGR